jgi:molecular chaperone GrpE
MSDRKPQSTESPAASKQPEDAAISGSEGELAELTEQLQKKTEEAAANQDRYLRALAEAENTKKRVQREKAEAIRYANENLLRDLLPVIDSLEIALDHSPEGGNGKSVVEGIQLTLKMFRDVLQRHGVKEVDTTAGRPFDPATQEAAAIEDKAGAEPNTVIRVQSKGYTYNDRLLRPARVVVASAQRKEPDPGTVH